MNERSGSKGSGEHGVRYARFVNRTVGGWQMAAEAAFVSLCAFGLILAAACFD